MECAYHLLSLDRSVQNSEYSRGVKEECILYFVIMTEATKHISDVKDTKKKLPHGVDVYKEDLDGEYWWLKDNDYLYRGYRTKLSFGEAFRRYS